MAMFHKSLHEPGELTLSDIAMKTAEPQILSWLQHIIKTIISCSVTNWAVPVVGPRVWND